MSKFYTIIAKNKLTGATVSEATGVEENQVEETMDRIKMHTQGILVKFDVSPEDRKGELVRKKFSRLNI